MSKELDRNCAIMERTGDGVKVGRCWYFVGENFICPRHGDVKEVQRRWTEKQDMTDELDHERVFP